MIIKFWFTFEILIHLNNLENSRTITTINHILNSYDKRERERREGEGEMLLKNASKSKLSNTCIIMLNIPSSSDFILSFAFSETYCNYRFGSKHSQIFLFLFFICSYIKRCYSYRWSHDTKLNSRTTVSQCFNYQNCFQRA